MINTVEEAMRPLTDDEWNRVRSHVASIPGAYLDSSEDGTFVGLPSGAIHPRFFLDLMDDPSPIEEPVIDILKFTPRSGRERNEVHE
jgi:hypothetical protein